MRAHLVTTVSADVFFQMSFETTVTFLTHAALHGEKDDLSSPAAQIVVGKAVEHGSGSFDVLANLNAMKEAANDSDAESD